MTPQIAVVVVIWILVIGSITEALTPPPFLHILYGTLLYSSSPSKPSLSLSLSHFTIQTSLSFLTVSFISSLLFEPFLFSFYYFIIFIKIVIFMIFVVENFWFLHFSPQLKPSSTSQLTEVMIIAISYSMVYIFLWWSFIDINSLFFFFFFFAENSCTESLFRSSALLFTRSKMLTRIWIDIYLY